MKRLKFSFLLISLCIAWGASLYAQQTPISSLYSYNPYAFNPAFAGLNYTLDINLGIRNQYTGLAGSPTSQHINIHAPIYKVGGAGGMTIDNETLGNFRKFGFQVSGNKIIDRSKFLLSLGARVGMSQLTIRSGDLITPDGVYDGGLPNHNDPIFDNVSVGSWSPTWVLGAYLRTRNIDVGLSIHQLPPYVVNIGSSAYQLSSHFDLFFQYRKRWSDSLLLKPAMRLKVNKAQVQTDLSLLLEYSGNIFGGVSLRGYNGRSLDSVITTIGTKISSRLSLIYAYDAGLSSLKRVNEGSHEIIINYRLDRLIGAGVSPKIIYNPRNL